MNEVDKEALDVYEFIWKMLKESETLTTTKQMKAALHHGIESITLSVKLLRAAGLIEQYSLLPTTYREWWREQRQKDQTWQAVPMNHLRSYQRRTRYATSVRPLSVSE